MASQGAPNKAALDCYLCGDCVTTKAIGTAAADLNDRRRQIK